MYWRNSGDERTCIQLGADVRETGTERLVRAGGQQCGGRAQPGAVKRGGQCSKGSHAQQLDTIIMFEPKWYLSSGRVSSHSYSGLLRWFAGHALVARHVTSDN